MSTLRLAVVGHVEHVCLGLTGTFPAPGDIVHLRDARSLPAGGGGLAFAQFCHSDAEVHFFTALGDDDAGRSLEALLRAGRAGRAGVHVHVARRVGTHPRVVVLVDDHGRRTILVTEPPLQPTAQDALPWDLLGTCDGVYFTGSDPESLRLARACRRLVVSARRGAVLTDARVAADVVVGSASDARENAAFESYAPAPDALVLTDGSRAVRVTRRLSGELVSARVEPPVVERAQVRGDYGAGDSFAAALTFFVAAGLPVVEACGRAAPFGAAVLLGTNPLELQARLVAP